MDLTLLRAVMSAPVILDAYFVTTVRKTGRYLTNICRSAGRHATTTPVVSSMADQSDTS